MSRVLAFVDQSPCAAGVVRTATSLAALLGATLDAIWVAVCASRASAIVSPKR